MHITHRKALPHPLSHIVCCTCSERLLDAARTQNTAPSLDSLPPFHAHVHTHTVRDTLLQRRPTRVCARPRHPQPPSRSAAPILMAYNLYQVCQLFWILVQPLVLGARPQLLPGRSPSVAHKTPISTSPQVQLAKAWSQVSLHVLAVGGTPPPCSFALLWQRE